MDHRLLRLEETVGAMELAIASLENRIAELERGKPGIVESVPETSETDPEASLVPDFRQPVATVLATATLIGRSLLVLAGAFLLRALTEGGSFAPGVGVAVGVAYAAVWIVASALSAKNGARASAGFFAGCSALIVGPLLFEASTSFGVLSPTASAIALATITGCGLAVASRWQFQSTAWVFCLGALVTAAAMATKFPPGEAATALIVGLGLAVLWLAGRHDWDVLNWVTAFSADLAVLRLTAIATFAGSRPESFGVVHPLVVAGLQLLLVVGYTAWIVLRALKGQRPLKVFDFAQTAVVLAVGLGGILQLTRFQGWSPGLLSLATVGFGLAAYGGAFGIVDRRQGRNRAFLYLSSLGLCLVLIGLPAVLGGASAVVWSVAAVAVAAVGSRWDRVTLRVHAAVLLIAAWVLGGVAVAVAARLGEEGSSSGFGPVLVAFLTVVTTSVVLAGRRLRSSGWAQRLPLAVMLAMSGFVVASTIAMMISTILGRSNAMVVGTVALSLTTIGLAVVGAKGGVVEAGWLVYPFLVVAGLRMISVDLSSGRTIVLVISLAAYGAALIISTRMLHSGRSSTPET